MYCITKKRKEYDRWKQSTGQLIKIVQLQTQINKRIRGKTYTSLSNFGKVAFFLSIFV